MQVRSREAKIGDKNSWLKAMVLVISWLLIISLARDVWQIRAGFDRISETMARLESEEVKNLRLNQKLSLVNTESYREKLIREKLNMQREGEVLVVLPKEDFLGKDRKFKSSPRYFFF